MKPPRIYPRAGHFWIRYFVSGKKNEVRRTTGIVLDIEPATVADWWKKSKHRAKLAEALKDIQFEREARERGIIVEEQPTAPDLFELLDEFNGANAIERDRERAPATLHHRKNAVDFLNRNLQRRQWYSIDRNWIIETRRAAKSDLAPATLRGYFTILKMLFAYALREKYITSNPFIGVSISVPKKNPPRIPIEEEKKLFQFLYHKNRPLFEQAMFQRLTGLRVNEVCQLEWKSVERPAWRLTYSNPKPPYRDEVVPLSGAAQYLLSNLSERRDPYIFAFRNKRTMVYYMKRASAHAAVEHIRTHQLKRGYLQELRKASPDVHVYQALAHHAPSENRVAIEFYVGKDYELMFEALENMQAHWLDFMKALPATKWDSKKYLFANPKSHANKDTTGTR